MIHRIVGGVLAASLALAGSAAQGSPPASTGFVRAPRSGVWYRNSIGRSQIDYVDLARSAWISVELDRAHHQAIARTSLRGSATADWTIYYRGGPFAKVTTAKDAAERILFKFAQWLQWAFIAGLYPNPDVPPPLYFDRNANMGGGHEKAFRPDSAITVPYSMKPVPGEPEHGTTDVHNLGGGYTGYIYHLGNGDALYVIYNPVGQPVDGGLDLSGPGGDELLPDVPELPEEEREETPEETPEKTPEEDPKETPPADSTPPEPGSAPDPGTGDCGCDPNVMAAMVELVAAKEASPIPLNQEIKAQQIANIVKDAVTTACNLGGKYPGGVPDDVIIGHLEDCFGGAYASYAGYLQ